MNDQLRETYVRLNEKLEGLNKESVEILADEWRAWFEQFGVEVTDAVVDAAVVTAAGGSKQIANIVGEPAGNRAERRKEEKKRGVFPARLLEQSLLSVTVLASLRPTKVV